MVLSFASVLCFPLARIKVILFTPHHTSHVILYLSHRHKRNTDYQENFVNIILTNFVNAISVLSYITTCYNQFILFSLPSALSKRYVENINVLS